MVALARVTKPIGLNGGVRVQLLCDGPDRLRDVQQLYRGPEPAGAIPVALREISVRGNGIVVFFEDCTSREGAEELRDQYLFIEEAESVPPVDDRPRIHTLLGCEVRTQDGATLGIISNVYDLPSYRMIGVTGPGAPEEVLVPYVDAWIAAFDPDRKLIVLGSDELFKDE